MGGSQARWVPARVRAPQVAGSIYRRNHVEPERLEPTLAERLDASVELFSEAKAAAEAGADEPTLTSDSRKQALRERVSEFRKRLVIKESRRRWWQLKNR